MMNNIKYYQEDDQIVAEWADRALDDEDRDLPDTIKIFGRVAMTNYTDYDAAKEAARQEVLRKYNAWIDERS